MTKKELIEALQALDCPDDTEIVDYANYPITKVNYYEDVNLIELA